MKIKKLDAKISKTEEGSKQSSEECMEEQFSLKNVIKETFLEKDPIALTIFILKIVLWCMLMTLFVMLEFGAVFFIFSLFYFMFTNFRKTEKRPGEISAYSVFNPNCEQIDGTLTAKQFERELLLGPAALQH